MTKEEEAARLRIVEHQPRNDRASKLKLTYMAAYLFATRGALKGDEMASVMLAADP
uniref:Uncharacterized protein n=1 Tax=Rhizobium meliloti TaxID=382 RepID=I2E256_RHIML|nr:hypothetical protein pHRC017_0541 [Sinorhizobium meliloti]